ncbi:MAG: hypothetical protein LBK55_02925 [Azoarcus sp.]|jgi:hypothetical protein|nr:hypothetical protein [Azoarcus sp.]
MPETTEPLFPPGTIFPEDGSAPVFQKPETIEILYQPMRYGLYYHTLLLYTDREGNKWAARGGPENGMLHTTVQPYKRGHDDWNEEGDDLSLTVAKGQDLSGVWHEIADAVVEMDNKSEYGQISNNCHTVTSIGLHAAGINYRPHPDISDWQAPGAKENPAGGVDFLNADDKDDERDGGGGAGESAQPGEAFPDMTAPTDGDGGSTAGDSGGWVGSLGGLLGNLLSNIFSAIGNFLRETLASINPRTDSEDTAPDAPLENTPSENGNPSGNGTPSTPESTEPDVPPESGEAPAASENPAENPATGNAAPPAESGNPSGNGIPSVPVSAPAFDDSSFSIPSGILDHFPEAPNGSSQSGQSTGSASESGGGSSPSSSGILDYSPAAPGGSFSGDSSASGGAEVGDIFCDPGASKEHPALDAYGNPAYDEGITVYCLPDAGWDGISWDDDVMGEFNSGGYPGYSDFMDNPAGWDSDYMGGSGGDLASMDDSGYSDPAGWDSDAWGPGGGGCAACNWYTGDVCDWVSDPGCGDGNCMC